MWDRRGETRRRGGEGVGVPTQMYSRVLHWGGGPDQHVRNSRELGGKVPWSVSIKEVLTLPQWTRPVEAGIPRIMIFRSAFALRAWAGLRALLTILSAARSHRAFQVSGGGGLDLEPGCVGLASMANIPPLLSSRYFYHEQLLRSCSVRSSLYAYG